MGRTSGGFTRSYAGLSGRDENFSGATSKNSAVLSAARMLLSIFASSASHLSSSAVLYSFEQNRLRSALLMVETFFGSKLIDLPLSEPLLLYHDEILIRT